MDLKQSDEILLQVAHLSITDCDYMMNRKVWEVFQLGRNYEQLLIKEAKNDNSNQ